MIFIALGTILLAINVNTLTEKTEVNKCYVARTCIHNAIEKCGANPYGEVRRFFDSCDMLEYNCLFDAEFTKVVHQNCKDLPPIPAEVKREDNITESDMERKGKITSLE